MSEITHYDGCWRDPKHHACAVREIERLRSVAESREERVRGLIAEVERLRSRLKLSIDYADGIPTGYGEDEIDRQQAEIERLHEDRETRAAAAKLMADHLVEYEKMVTERDSEIERLRRELADLAAGWLRTYEHDTNKLKASLAEKSRDRHSDEAEIERLRGLLREHLSGPTEVMSWRQTHEWHEDYLKRVRETLGDE